MLLIQTVHFNLEGLTSNKYIHSLMTAFDFTFVTRHIQFQPAKGREAKTCILHITKQAKLINKFVFPEIIDNMKMIRDDQLLLPLVAKDQIQVINLRTLQKKTISFGFIGNPFQQLFFFNETDLLCIKQIDSKNMDYDSQNQTEMSISYIDLSKDNEILKYQYKKSNQNENYILRKKIQKGNNHSLLFLIINKSTEIQVILHDIEIIHSKMASRIRKVSIPMSYTSINCQFKLWQYGNKLVYVSPNQYGFYPLFAKIIDINTNNSNISSLKINLKGNISVVFLNNWIYLRAWDNSYFQKVIPFQILDTRLQNVLFEEKESFAVKRSDISCDYDSDLLLKKSDDLYYKTTILTLNRWIQMKDFYMHLLLYINEDFDDDLLMEALDVLDCL